MKVIGAALAALVSLALVVVVLLGGDNDCSTAEMGHVDVASVPDVTDAGLSGDAQVRAEQLTNTALIMNAAAAMDLDAAAQAIGVMTAWGESTLINVDHGDDVHGVTNPDGSPTCSLGLFQQQWCLGWGTREQVMDPTYAATAFFERMVGVEAWREMEPTLVAHKVQRNANPQHYAKFHAGAVKLVAALSGAALGCEAEDPEWDAGVGPGGWGGYSNGRIPVDQLAPIPWASGQMLRPDATRALTRLNTAYVARFGSNIAITDSYRDFDAQVRVKAAKGALAATPGTSNHGWGLAVDLGGGINRFGTPQHTWMRANAPGHGWVLPGWAQQGGAKPEPWHWEYVGGGSS